MRGERLEPEDFFEVVASFHERVFERLALESQQRLLGTFPGIGEMADVSPSIVFGASSRSWQWL